jgi:hypothetical protein
VNVSFFLHRLAQKILLQNGQQLAIRNNFYRGSTSDIVTANSGYANETNMRHLHDNSIDAYIPDNQFRSRDPKLTEQKSKYDQRLHDHGNQYGAFCFCAGEWCNHVRLCDPALSQAEILPAQPVLATVR